MQGAYGVLAPDDALCLHALELPDEFPSASEGDRARRAIRRKVEQQARTQEAADDEAAADERRDLVSCEDDPLMRKHPPRAIGVRLARRRRRGRRRASQAVEGHGAGHTARSLEAFARRRGEGAERSGGEGEGGGRS